MKTDFIMTLATLFMGFMGAELRDRLKELSNPQRELFFQATTFILLVMIAWKLSW